MSLYLTNPISIPLKADKSVVTNKLCRLLRVKPNYLKSVALYKRSIDARNKSSVHFVCSYVVDCNVTPVNAVPYAAPADVFCNAPKIKKQASCVVIGAGPAGLFAALYLSKCGLNVTVIERGADIEKRKTAVQSFFDGGGFNPETNVQFGLGGAGAFSDGKLTSGLGYTPLGRTVFTKFAECGAPEEIMYDALPHIGTDRLAGVVANLRDEIISNGGKILFDSAVTDVIIKDGKAVGVQVCTQSKVYGVFADYTVLACGHSARDTFEMLNRRGALMQFKPFAVGLRVEHTRSFIDNAQYGKIFASHRDLGSATYKLTYKCADGHGCYSFCMCPGGTVVAANSQRDTVVVNGMSNYSRNAANSNSALVVTVDAQDAEKFGYGSDVFAGMRFQQDLERKTYVAGGGGYVAPCQIVTDFIANRTSVQFDVSPSYPRGVVGYNLRSLLPKTIGDNLAEALLAFDRKIVGFAQSGVLTAVETRTSSPVKILRDETYQSSLKRLYPAGEGAGYAGGIVSSAADGLKVATAIAEDVLKCE